jgi:hypothetical protein
MRTIQMIYLIASPFRDGAITRTENKVQEVLNGI